MPPDRKTFLTYQRIGAAAMRAEPFDDLGVTITGARVVKEGASDVLHVDVHLSPERVKFTTEQGRHLAAVEGTYFAADKRGMLTGDAWKTVDFALTEANHQRFQREGVSWTQRVVLTGPATHVKVILYQYASDRVGSAVTEIKTPKKR